MQQYKSLFMRQQIINQDKQIKTNVHGFISIQIQAYMQVACTRSDLGH